MKVDLLKTFLIACAIFLFGAPAYASQLFANITQIGCHIDKEMCFVYVDPEVLDDTPCSDSTSLRWAGKSNSNSSAAYATLLAAKTSGKRVRFGGVGETCFSGYTSFKYLMLID